MKIRLLITGKGIKPNSSKYKIAVATKIAIEIKAKLMPVDG